MASVSVVSSTDFRANLSQPQNNAPEGEDPFSLLLNAVTDVNANVGVQDEPRAAERRDDVPAKQPKPEADGDRQAKKQAKDAEKPEVQPQTESAAPAKPVEDDTEGDETETDESAEDAAPVETLLMIALNDNSQQTAVSAGISAGGTADVAAAATIAATTVNAPATETQTAPALAAAVADVMVTASADTQPAQTAPNAAQTKIQFDIAAAPANAEAEVQTAPALKIAAEEISSLLKPLQANAKIEGQLQAQPGSINVATATRLEGPAPLEMLNAAINKHIQLALGADSDAQPQEAQKPLLSSNAVAPNFAMTAQVNAPVQVQTQQVVEASRAVPLDQLAVEIATRANKGERRFDIRLDPPELGRIDVRLEIDSKGNTTTKLIVERAETLDMLQRDARGLEKALQNAGLKTDAGGMQFSLQQDTQAQHGHQNHAPEMSARPDLVRAGEEVMAEVSINNATLAAQIRGGVDIRI